MKDRSTEDCFFGSVTVGERGQVVIPADVRKSLHIEAGDRLLVFQHPLEHGIILTRIDSVQEVMAYFQKAIDAFHQEHRDNVPAEEENK